MYYALAIAAIVAFLFLVRWYKKRDPVAAAVSGDDHIDYHGVKIAAHVAIDLFEVAEKIRDGVAEAAADATVLGYTQKLSVADYKISIVERKGYDKGVAYFNNYLAGDSVPKECVIIVPDGFEKDAIRHECEHVILYWCDRPAYEATNYPSHQHPLLPALIKERGLG